MKFILICFFIISSFSTFAKYEGSWKTKCFQYQSNNERGYAVETYSFDKSMNYTLTREIYRDTACQDTLIQTIKEKGIVKIGNENTNNGFNPANTKEAVYTTASRKVDLGLIWVDSKNKILKIARGISEGVQNTLLGLFEYKKVN